MNEKIDTAYFDLDGTIVDLYGQKQWLEQLLSEDVAPYLNAQPLVDMNILENKLLALQDKNISIGVITWLSKGATKEYKQKTTQAKKEWLKIHLPQVKFDEQHFVAYGTPKHRVAKMRNGILFDDDLRVGKNWQKYGTWVQPKNDKTIINHLDMILKGK